MGKSPGKTAGKDICVYTKKHVCVWAGGTSLLYTSLQEVSTTVHGEYLETHTWKHLELEENNSFNCHASKRNTYQNQNGKMPLFNQEQCCHHKQQI